MRTLISTLLLSLSLNAQAADREFRLFAAAYRHDVSRVADYASFDTSVRALFAEEIAPKLRADAPNLVTFPENQTLMAYLLGARGALGRATLADTGAIPAIAGLAAPYAPQIDYYAAKFPLVDSPGQLLQLALTDTLARLIVETFGGLAAEYGVYLAVSSNLAPFERIEGATAVLLGDPEAGTGHAYEATAPAVYNRNFVFGPDGALLTIQDKAYLVPVERERQLGLGLLGVEVDNIPVFDLPFARIATVISKDAWMIDVNDRLDQLGAELLIQSEAFSTWGVAGEDLWPPDKFQRGGWWMLQKHPALAVNATPMLTGNFGDLTFDGQALIAVEAPGGDPALCLMGQRPEPGWAAVGGWSTLNEDPRALCDPARRAELADRATRMLPGSGDALENAYGETVVFADILLPPLVHGDRVGGAAPPVSRTLPGEASQFQPALAAAGDGAWLAWIDFGDGIAQTLTAARIAADGAAGAAQPVAPLAPATHDHFDNQWSPAVAVAGDEVQFAWLEFRTENWDLVTVRAGADATARIDDADREPGTLRERGHSAPLLLARPGGGLVAVWSDLRWPFVKPQIRIADSDDGANWSPSRRADGRATSFEDEQHDGRDPGESRGQVWPSAVFDETGGLVIAWQEADASGLAAVWVASAGGAPQRLSGSAAAYRPRLAADADRLYLVYEERDSAGGTRLMWRQHAGGSWSRAATLDPTALAGAVQREARPLVQDGKLLVIYEDHRGGDADLLRTHAGDPAPSRVDDAPAGAHSRAPAAAMLADGRILAAWQDDRDGVEKIRYAIFPADTARQRSGAAGPLLLALIALYRRRRFAP